MFDTGPNTYMVPVLMSMKYSPSWSSSSDTFSSAVVKYPVWNQGSNLSPPARVFSG